MKVVDFLKHKREILAQHPLSSRIGSLRRSATTGVSFQQKAHLHPLLGRVLDLQGSPRMPASKRLPESPRSRMASLPWRRIPWWSSKAKRRHSMPSCRPASVKRPMWASGCRSQALINQFATVTGDHQWIHTDPERAAAESLPKTTIAHGFLTLALLPVDRFGGREHAGVPDSSHGGEFRPGAGPLPLTPIKVDSNIRARTKLSRVTPIKGGIRLLQARSKIEIGDPVALAASSSRSPGSISDALVLLHETLGPSVGLCRFLAGQNSLPG